MARTAEDLMERRTKHGLHMSDAEKRAFSGWFEASKLRREKDELMLRSSEFEALLDLSGACRRRSGSRSGRGGNTLDQGGRNPLDPRLPACGLPMPVGAT